VTSGENTMTIKLAAVQIRAEPGQAGANQRHAARLVE
jgi:hypothetical protein